MTWKRGIGGMLAAAVALLPAAAPSASAQGETAGPFALPQLLQEMRRANPDLEAARKRWEAAQQKIPL